MRTCLALALLVVGCRAPDSYRALPQPDRDAFARCEPHMELCESSPVSWNYDVPACFRREKGEFAKRVTPRERGMWLIRHGCPPPIIAEFYD